MGSPLLDRPGAVAGRGVDGGVAAHYGDPFREQRTLIESGAVVDRSHRGVVRVSGADRLSWLHSLTSQHHESQPAGEPREALILSPHGHVEHHLVVVDDGAQTWLTAEPQSADSLVAYLNSMRFMLRVEVEDLSGSYGVVSEVADGAVRDHIVGLDEVASWVSSSPLPLVGHDAWEAHRVARHVPRLGFETDHRTIPHEVGWIGVAVHLDKGCYRGQETVARVHNLGRPPRRLVFGHLDGTQDQLPDPHTPVELDGRAVGFLGTAVHHAELGPIALAVVKRATPDGAPLTTAGMAMKIERVVDA
ncbi:MAG TPA: folate-binding protein [Mycobacteriales bacterium]|nr:folate-binding protein [Mycobacteriales bacterium]HVV76609.1 folate-binding protein [Mycobacteriales bacterium]